MRYNPEQKSDALARIAAVGVQATSQEFGISAQTLYKWQREQNNVGVEAAPPTMPAFNSEDLRQFIQRDNSLEVAYKRLEEENDALRAENSNLLQTISQLKKAFIAVLGQ